MRWRTLAAFVASSLLLLTTVGRALDAPARSTIVLTFAGDMMLGRSVAPVVSADPDGVFRDIRHIFGASDVVFANLESPLTDRTSDDPNDHIGDPATADLLASAGFDVLSVANNHARDAGHAGLADTVATIERAGMRHVDATDPLLVDVGGLRVGVVAIHDAPDDTAIRDDISRAEKDADLVVASVHGGVEYLPDPDPRLRRLAERLVAWGADVVWGHGAHVVQPVTTSDTAAGRTAVVATSLGNLLFDQRGPLTGRGAVLQVRADRNGVLGFRTGTTSHHDLRVHFTGWDVPNADAVLWDDGWWTPVRPLRGVAEPAEIGDFPWGEVVAAGTGHLMEERVVVVSFRHVPGPHPVRDGLEEIRWTDATGRSQHLGIYRAADLRPLWVAGMVPAPVVGLAVCDGAVALAYGTLDDSATVSTGAAVWRPVGLDPVDPLPGPGTPGCADVDGDGRPEAVVARP